MTALPNIPRLYTALAEVLAVLLYAMPLPRRFGSRATAEIAVLWIVALSAFLYRTGHVPLVWWIPCMLTAVAMLYGYLWLTRAINWMEALYITSWSFILAEFAASVEWQLHCWMFPWRSGADPLALVLLAVVYGVIYGAVYWLEHRRIGPLKIDDRAVMMALVMAATVFAVSNLLFLGEGTSTMNAFRIRTLVDFCGVLILTVQHDQLREASLHRELEAMDNILHRKYEQYQRSKEGVKLINRRYHELKVQIAEIRAERDRAKQDAALAEMENSILQYEAENKTGNPVLDTLLTSKSMECQEKQIRMTSVADGHLLDHLTTHEICVIVGTALDNAIECCEAEPDPEKRLIRTAVYAQNGFVLFRVENYCAKPVKLGENGLPLYSAHGGYDLRSLQAAAQKHGGSMTVHWEDDWFSLRVLLPQPSETN